ncbi:bile acid:sodium symporter [Fischerella sp. JS2]|uniref:bile acid:sodium symporter family protein n=1 Tax=Fischerella sp. JS2 TaxID=2597771 RepID=UPI0028EFB02E|nr:bile acid:sodium symporter [Fischerella sp. JS2]
MSEILQVITKLAILVFVIASMLSMGLSLTVRQILVPLRNTGLVLLSLVANFILVPLVVYLLLQVVPLSKPFQVGLIILATAAGAPFLPKLAQVAKGNTAFSVGLMVLLMVGTIIYMPIVLPLVLKGVQVNPWDIAKPLIFLMLVPLALSLFVKARYEAIAATLQPIMTQTSSFALMLGLVIGLILQFRTLIGLFGTGALITSAVFIVVAFILGYFLGGPGSDTQRVLGLGTAQRNISAALLVGASNFDDPNVVIIILAASLLMLVILMFMGGELGRRAEDSRQASIPVGKTQR